jgi:uncharacterized membrane protein YqjE
VKTLCDILAVVGNIVGAILVAFSAKSPNLAIAGYLFFLVGAIFSIWLLRHSNASKSLISINIYFIVVNVIGIITRIDW